MKSTVKLISLVLSLLSAILIFASCDDVQKIIDGATEHTHDYDDWITVTEPTCTAEGEWVRYCDCGEKQTEPIPAIGHAYVNGICSVCSDKETAGGNTPGGDEGGNTPGGDEGGNTPGGDEGGNTPGGDEGGNTPGGDEDGNTPGGDEGGNTPGGDQTEENKCKHSKVSVEIIEGTAPTCDLAGSTYGVKCLGCDKMIIPQESIPALGHSYNAENICENCGNTRYPWKKTGILVQLYENDNNGELYSGLKRYCAGQDTAGTDEIDVLVRNRNSAASKYSGVSATYNYQTNYGWGSSVNNISTLVMSGSSSAPDVFANFVYDMTSCALRGCFANLYSNTNLTDTKYGNGENYFRFTKEDYSSGNDYEIFESNKGEGYFYDYMKSLTIANEEGVHDKMYILASNYTIDAIRSMLVIPVNLEMLREIPIEQSIGDLDYDGDFDTADFYELVWSYDWTYDALAQLSSAVFEDENKAVNGADILDTLGFCISKSQGMASAGILYSSDLKIINKTVVNGKTTYEYPDRNYDLINLTDSLYYLFINTEGVCAISTEDAKNAGFAFEKNFDSSAIRYQFRCDNLLFGGVTMLGSFEEIEYQQMNESGNGGFGFVPVPLYAQDYEHTHGYNTLVHNLGRVFAISANTYKFEQCTMYYDFLSTRSSEVVDLYFDMHFISEDDSDEEIENKLKMFNFVKNSAYTAFDKTYDDIINEYLTAVDISAVLNRWHAILCSNGYVVENMDRYYSELYIEKQRVFETVLEEWAKLK